MASDESEEVTTKLKLTKLECPFNWEMLDSLIKYIVTGSKYRDEEYADTVDIKSSYPLEVLLKCLYRCYKDVISADNDIAMKEIEKAEQILMQIQQDQELHQIIRTIEHVFYATKCFLLYESNNMDEIKEILENIIDPKDFNDIESGALYGCKSSIWSCLHDFGIEEAIDTAKRAIKMNQDCALWHFILGKNLRRKRRATNVSSDVSDSEKNHFEIAHAISKNQMFEVYYLQMCMESFKKFIRSRDYVIKKNANEREVISKAKKMLNTNPTDHKVLLKLALIFLRTRISDERYSAKKCLDAVNKIVPNNTTYLHYTAMLYEQSGDYKEAIKYFKKAAECNNLVAELSYIQYGWETGQLEPLPHLLRMLKKYDQSIKSRQIAMLLAIAITYYSLHEDIPNAAEYFLKALEIDPVHKKFQVYYKFLDFNTLNISSFLNNNFCPLLEKKYPAHTETCKKIKNLLNVKDITDLVEEMCGLSVEKKKF